MIVQFPSRMYGNTPNTTPCIRCGADTFLNRLCYCCKWIDGVIEDKTGKFIPNHKLEKKNSNAKRD